MRDLATSTPKDAPPHIAVATLFVIAAPLALWGSIGDLAAATVLLLLAVFAVMNSALFLLKGRKGEKRGYFEVPRLVPALGVLVCLALIIVRVTTGDWRASAIAGGLLFGSLVIYALVRPKAAPDQVASY